MLFFMIVPFVHAITPNSSLVAYWELENLLDSSGNGNDLTTTSSPTLITTGCHQGSCYDFDGTSNFLNGGNILDTSQPFTLSLWVLRDTTDNRVPISVGQYDGQIDGFYTLWAAENINFYYGNNNVVGRTTTNNYFGTGLHHLAVVYDGTNIKTYADGTLDINSAVSLIDTTFPVLLGDRSTTHAYLNGVIDEVSVWDTAFNQAEIEDIYNNGIITGGTPEITFTNTTFNNVTLTNNSLWNTNQTELYAEVQNISTNDNIDIRYRLEYFFNSSWTLINSQFFVIGGTNGSVTLDTSLDGDYRIYLNATNNETSTQTDFYYFEIDTEPANVSVNEFTEWNTGYNVTNLNQTLNITCEDPNIDECEIHWSDNTTTNLFTTQWKLFSSSSNYTFSLHSHDLANNTAEANGTLFINPAFYIYFEDANSLTLISDFEINGTNYSNYFTGNTFDLGLGTHNFLFSKYGYTTTTFNFTLNETSNINITISMNISKVIINIYDRNTNNRINEPVSIVLVGTIGYNTTTITGQVNVSSINFLDESYQLISSSLNYESESVYFDWDNRETLNIDVYLIKSNQSNLGIHTIKAITDTGLLVNEAICSALEWKPELSSFVTVAQGLTDSNGETNLNIELGVKLYKFKCIKGTVEAYSGNKVITSSGSITTILLATTIITPVNIFGGLSYSLVNSSINITHQRITYTFTDSNGLVDLGCLYIYQVIGTKYYLIQSSCVSSSSAIIQLIQNINQTYNIRAIATIEIDGVTTNLDYIDYINTANFKDALNIYGLDVLICLLIILLGVSLGFLIAPQNIYISIIGIIISTWICVGIFQTLISGVVATFITLICGLMFWGAYRSK